MSELIAQDQDDREVPLCPGCLAPVEPHDAFCEICGQPLTSAATTLPMERIRSLGEITRRSAERPKTIALIGIWLIFGPPVLILLIMAIAFPLPAPQTFDQLPSTIFSLACTFVPVLLFGGILWRTTARYFTTAHSEPAGMEPGDDEPGSDPS